MAIIRLRVDVAPEETIGEAQVNFPVAEGSVIRVNSAWAFAQPKDLGAGPFDTSELSVAVVGRPVLGWVSYLGVDVAASYPAILLFSQFTFGGLEYTQGESELTHLVEANMAVSLDNRLYVAASLGGANANPRPHSILFLLDVEPVKVTQEMAARIATY